MTAWGEGDRPEERDPTGVLPDDPDATSVLPRYPGGLDAPTHVYPTVPSRPTDPTGPSGGPSAPYPGYSSPAAGYGPPGYRTPGYETPGYGTPGYGPSGYGAPGYRSPAYGSPGYATPGPGAPGYAADATVEQPRVRSVDEFPGGIDDTHPLPPTPPGPPPLSAESRGRSGDAGWPDRPTAPGTAWASGAGPDEPGRGAPPDQPRDGAPAEPDGVEGAGASVAKHSSVMALGSIISRVTGFIRTAAIGAAIGAAAVGDDYGLANVLPGMVYELLLGGVLASVVVPLLVRARKRDPDRGEAYTQRLLSLAAVFLATATAVAVLCAPLFTLLLTNDQTPPADRRLITTLSYLLLPMIFFYGMAALFAAVLNTRGHFAMPTFAPILNNLVVIAMCGAFILTPAIDKNDAASLSGAQVALLGLGTTFGIVVQTAGLLPALRRVGFRWRWRWDFRELHLAELGRVSSWMLVYVAVSQVAQVVIFKLAYSAANTAGAAGPAIYLNAFLIFMMAHGIIAVSVITALMPRMSAAAAEQRHSDLADLLSLGTRLTAVVLVPATVAYIVLGRPLAVTLFEWGNYDHEEAVATGWVIAVAGLGLIPFAVSQLQLFAFYAMPDTKTPAMINLPVVAVRIGIDLLLYVVLPATLVAAGLMFGNAVSFVVAAGLGYLLLRQRVGPLGMRRVFRTLSRLGLAGLIAAVPTVVGLLTLSALWGDGKGASVVQLLLCGPILIGAYLGAATWLRVPEVKELIGMVRARLGR
jgi:putative peptidoglycan lipid II flippase